MDDKGHSTGKQSGILLKTLKLIHYLLIFIFSSIIFTGTYGYIITMLEDRKEMYLYGTTTFVVIFAIYLGLTQLIKRLYKKRLRARSPKLR